jgi:hypothetical protein
VIVAQPGAPSQPLAGENPARHCSQDHVEVALAGPVDRLVDAVDVLAIEQPGLGLERRPVHEQADRVEADAGNLVEVAGRERDDGVELQVGAVVVAELVHVDAAQQHLSSAGVDDRRVGAGFRV